MNAAVKSGRSRTLEVYRDNVGSNIDDMLKEALLACMFSP